MSILIKNPEAESAIRALAAATGLSLQDAVARACRNEIERGKQQEPLAERIEKLRARARQILGEPNPDFDQRAFSNEMWEL